MKKTLLILLSVLMCLSFSGCGSNLDDITKPDYSKDIDSKKIEIGMFVGVPTKISIYNENGQVVSTRKLSDEEFLQHYQYIKDCGFTVAMPGYGETSLAYAKKALETANKVGVKQLVQDIALNNLLLNSEKDEKQILAQAEMLISSYKDYESFGGNIIKDEPSALLFDKLARAKRLYEKLLPGKLFYVNLLPVIAGTEGLGGVTYNEYVDQFIEKVDTDYVMYDHYPLLQDGFGTTKVDDVFLYNMEIVKTKAQKKNKEFWTIIQSIGYGSDHRTPKSVADLSWQAYSALAYGCTGINWFCYFSPPAFDGAITFEEGAIGRDGNKTAVYDYMSIVNNQLNNFDHIYKNFEWKGVMPLIGDKNVKGTNKAFDNLEFALKSHSRIKKVKSEEDLIIGTFTDKENRDGFMAVNYADPGMNLKSKLEIDFNDAKAVMYIRDGKEIVEKIKNGKFTITMNAGEGLFIIPLK